MMDIDEFVVPRMHTCLADLLHKYRTFASVCLQWQTLSFLGVPQVGGWVGAS